MLNRRNTLGQLFCSRMDVLRVARMTLLNEPSGRRVLAADDKDKCLHAEA